MFGSFNTNFQPFGFNSEEENEDAQQQQKMDDAEDPIDWLIGLPNPSDALIEINGPKRRFSHIPSHVPLVPAQVMKIMASDNEIARDHQDLASAHMCLPVWLQTSPMLMFLTGKEHWSPHGRGYLQTMCQLYQFRDAVIKGKAIQLHKSVNLDNLIASYKFTLRRLSDEQDDRLDLLYLNEAPGNLDTFHMYCCQYALDIIHLEERFLYELLVAPYENVPPLETMLSVVSNSLFPKTAEENELHRKQAYLFFQLKVERVQQGNPTYPKTIRYQMIENSTDWLPNDVLIDYYHFGNEG